MRPSAIEERANFQRISGAEEHNALLLARLRDWFEDWLQHWREDWREDWLDLDEPSASSASAGRGDASREPRSKIVIETIAAGCEPKYW